MEDAMADIDTALAASRDAADQLIRAGEQSGASWTAPRAPGKWSPSQIVEHVAGGLEEAANMAAGRPTIIPRLPADGRASVSPELLDVVFLISCRDRSPGANGEDVSLRDSWRCWRLAGLPCAFPSLDPPGWALPGVMR